MEITENVIAINNNKINIAFASKMNIGAKDRERGERERLKEVVKD